jgi:hypothetical protein
LPVTADGTGTLCSSDADCQGLDASHCLMADGQGFCTVEGCVDLGCGTPYVCCFGCNPAVAPMLPFEGSACLPEVGTDQLTNMAGCTCRAGVVDPTATRAIASATPTSTPSPTIEPSPRVGFEILEIQSPNSIRAWISSDITREEFDALELPEGWLKNQPRTGDPDASRFYRSPGAAVDGEFLDEELFGFNWRHSATVTETNIPLDEQGLLIGSTVSKFHEVTFNAGRAIIVLFSPHGEPYFRIGRDADRVSDEPSVPDSWRLVEYTTPEQLVIQLFGENLVIRTDNQDSFQGPVPELAVAF